MTVSCYTLLPLATPRELVGRVGSTAKTVTPGLPVSGDGGDSRRPGGVAGAGSLRVMGATMTFAALLSARPPSIRQPGGGRFVEARK
ncbi:hypothetical protein WME88_13325 [Sorangium sp. So ce216]